MQVKYLQIQLHPLKTAVTDRNPTKDNPHPVWNWVILVRLQAQNWKWDQNGHIQVKKRQIKWKAVPGVTTTVTTTPTIITQNSFSNAQSRKTPYPEQKNPNQRSGQIRSCSSPVKSIFKTTSSKCVGVWSKNVECYLQTPVHHGGHEW